MEHTKNKSGASRGNLRSTRPLFSFAILIAAGALLYAALVCLAAPANLDVIDSQIYTASGKAAAEVNVAESVISGFLYSLDRLASILLKAALIYLCLEAAKLLRKYRSGLSRQHAGRGKDQRQDASPPAPILPEEEREAFPVQPVPEPSAEQAGRPEPEPSGEVLKADEPVIEAPVYGQHEEHADLPQWIQLDLENERESLSVIDSGGRTPIYLKKVEKGPLVGKKVGDRRYQVFLPEEYLAEAELNYSAVTACFEITNSCGPGQNFKVDCNQPAILVEIGNGVYEIVEKGFLTVVSVV